MRNPSHTENVRKNDVTCILRVYRRALDAVVVSKGAERQRWERASTYARLLLGVYLGTEELSTLSPEGFPSPLQKPKRRASSMTRASR